MADLMEELNLVALTDFNKPTAYINGDNIDINTTTDTSLIVIRSRGILQCMSLPVHVKLKVTPCLNML